MSHIQPFGSNHVIRRPEPTSAHRHDRIAGETPKLCFHIPAELEPPTASQAQAASNLCRQPETVGLAVLPRQVG
jgi:hypothetical protein